MEPLRPNLGLKCSRRNDVTSEEESEVKEWLRSIGKRIFGYIAASGSRPSPSPPPKAEPPH
ncbi:hypothetical protein TIFTF001_016938 [Ficus carica]|uniref:Uncharacterized protein n=1 Tax=Ficus carica TaxID=3494 RepID=A0AA88ATV0_FICCA|nr:hypothetical protein TIFTF001_016938 [Ficus carica]